MAEKYAMEGRSTDNAATKHGVLAEIHAALARNGASYAYMPDNVVKSLVPEGNRAGGCRRAAKGGAEMWTVTVYKYQVKKCLRCLLFCGGCDIFAHCKGVVLFIFLGYYEYNTYFSDYQMFI